MGTHEIPYGYACGAFAEGVGQVCNEDDLAGLRFRVDLDTLHERLDQLPVLKVDGGLRGDVIEA